MTTRRTPTARLLQAARDLLAANARDQLVELVPILLSRIVQAEAIATAWRGLCFVLVSEEDAERITAAVAAIEAAYRGEDQRAPIVGGQ